MNNLWGRSGWWSIWAHANRRINTKCKWMGPLRSFLSLSSFSNKLAAINDKPTTKPLTDSCSLLCFDGHLEKTHHTVIDSTFDLHSMTYLLQLITNPSSYSSSHYCHLFETNESTNSMKNLMKNLKFLEIRWKSKKLIENWLKKSKRIKIG